MRALIRNPGETVMESYAIPGINWATGAPLTNRDWYGGPYTLVNDYVPKVSVYMPVAPTPEPAQDPAVEEPAPDTIVIDGVTYTRAP